MKYYRYSNLYFLVSGFAGVLFLVILIFMNSLFMKIGLGACSLVIAIDIVQKSKVKFVITDDILVEKRIFSEHEYFRWEDVKVIRRMPGKKKTFIVKSEGSYFCISPSIQNHAEMLETIIGKCQDSNDIEIDIN